MAPADRTQKLCSDASDAKDVELDVSDVLRAIGVPVSDSIAWTDILRRATQAIFNAQFDADKMPKRSELLEKFAKLEAAAMTVSRLVLDPMVLNAAPDLWNAFGSLEGLDVPGCMSRLLYLIESRRHLVQVGRGRVTSGPSYGHYGGRLLCAMVIIESWRRLRGRRPGSKNPKAQDACALLWRSAGGTQSEAVLHGEVERGASWERQLNEALKPGDLTPRRLPKRAPPRERNDHDRMQRFLSAQSALAEIFRGT
jgi:hypothetical protein